VGEKLRSLTLRAVAPTSSWSRTTSSPLLRRNQKVRSLRCFGHYLRRDVCTATKRRLTSEVGFCGYVQPGRRTYEDIPVLSFFNKKKPHPTRERGAGQYTDLVLRRLPEDDGRGEVVPSG
jgi:hypothetical protein